MPGVAGYIASGKFYQAKRRIEFSILVTILLGLPITAIMSVFSEQILLILFPNAPSGSELLSLSAVSIIFVMLIQTANGALQGLGKVAVPVIALTIRNSYKVSSKYSFDSFNRN
ncbi:MAG: MATE family efflux transporter [Oscillospiraceae bacterium]|nr:MATE family efflux transporter [Oscillospiraceae bacterium]